MKREMDPIEALQETINAVELLRDYFVAHLELHKLTLRAIVDSGIAEPADMRSGLLQLAERHTGRREIVSLLTKLADQYAEPPSAPDDGPPTFRIVQGGRTAEDG